MAQYRNNATQIEMNNLSKDNNSNNLKELEAEYTKELNEKFEQEKLSLNLELETNMIKEFEKYKAKAKKDKQEEIKKINDKINNISNDYYNDINIIKKQLESKNNNDNMIINEKLQKISSNYFSEIKNKYTKKIDEELKDIQNMIINIFKDINDIDDNENIEIKIEEKLIDRHVHNNSKLDEIKTSSDLIEKEYINTKLKIKYLSNVISLICRQLIEKSSDFNFNNNNNENKDDILVSEMVLALQNNLNEYKIKINDKIKKLYPFLDDEIDSMKKNIRKSNEQRIERNYNLYTSRNNYKNDYLMNNGINENNLYNLSENINQRKNDIYNMNQFSQLFPNNNNLNFLKTSRNEKNNPKKSYSLDKYQNNFNNNNMNKFSDIEEDNIINNNEINSNKDFKNNTDMGNGNMTLSKSYFNNLNPELPQEILNTFPNELLYLYNKIITFIKEESSSIEKDKNNLNNIENMNNTLKNLKDNDNLKSYQNDFNFILFQENTNSKAMKSNIQSKIKLFNKIKSFCEDTFNFIYNNYTKQNAIKTKLNILLEHIHDYNMIYNEDKNQIYSGKIKNMSYNFNNFNQKSSNFRYNSNGFDKGRSYNLRYGSTFRNSSYDKNQFNFKFN